MSARAVRSFALLATLATLATLAAGCAHHGRPLTPTGEDEEHLGFGASHKKPFEPGPVEAHLLASLSARTVGPFLARARPSAAEGAAGAAHEDERGMMAYLGAAADGSRALLSVPIDSVGLAAAEPVTVVAAPVDAANLAIHATSAASGTTAGYAAAFSSITDRGEAIYAVGIGNDGQMRAPLTELSGTTDHVVWLDLQTTKAGATCVWAEETRSGQANLFAAALDPDGKLHGSPSRVARNVRAWQTVPTDDGVGMALVIPVEGRRDDGRPEDTAGGSLSFLRLDRAAHAEGAPVVITALPEVGGDIDVVRVGRNFVFAWTDLGEADPFVATASVDAVDPAAKPLPPLRAVATTTGGSSLVALEAGPDGAVAILWDEPRKRGRATRRLHLQRLSPAGAVAAKAAAPPAPPGATAHRELAPPPTREPEVALDVAGHGNVELAGTPDGYAILADATACRLPPSDSPLTTAPKCDDAPIPTFLRFDANLRALDTEPLRMEADRTPARLAWALACGATGTCTALTVDAGSPAKVRDVRLVNRSDATFRAPLAPSAPDNAARVTSLRTVAGGAQYSDLAAVSFGDGGDLVAALAVNGARDGTGVGEATVSLVPVDADGIAGAPVILTPRAVLAGGLALARGSTDAEGAAVAWVGREAGDLQVHVSHVDRRGRRHERRDAHQRQGRRRRRRDRLGERRLARRLGRHAATATARSTPPRSGSIWGASPARSASPPRRATRSTSRSSRARARAGSPGLTRATTRPAASGGRLLRQDQLSRRQARGHRPARSRQRDPFAIPYPDRRGRRRGARLDRGSAARRRSADARTVRGDAAVGRRERKSAGRAGAAAQRRATGSPPGSPWGRPRAGGLRGVVARSVKDDLAIDVLEIGGAAGSTRAAPLFAPDAPSSFDVVMALVGPQPLLRRRRRRPRPRRKTLRCRRRPPGPPGRHPLDAVSRRRPRRIFLRNSAGEWPNGEKPTGSRSPAPGGAFIMDSRITTSLPDVTSVSSAPRPTAAPPSVPFSDVLAGTVVNGAESAMTVLPGGPIMATAIRGGMSHVSTASTSGLSYGGMGGVGASLTTGTAVDGRDGQHDHEHEPRGTDHLERLVRPRHGDAQRRHHRHHRPDHRDRRLARPEPAAEPLLPAGPGAGEPAGPLVLHPVERAQVRARHDEDRDRQHPLIVARRRRAG